MQTAAKYFFDDLVTFCHDLFGISKILAKFAP